MKTLLGILLLILCCNTSVLANEVRMVCANHILVPTEADAGRYMVLRLVQ